MMNKKQTSHRSIWKYALILPVLAILLFFNSALQTKAEPVNEINNVQQAPQKDQDKPVTASQQAPQKAQNKQAVTVQQGSKNAQDKSVANSSKPQIFNHVEVMPQFPGGEAALMKFLSENIIYPKEAQEKGIQGRVTLRFVVKPDGAVDDVHVVKNLDPLCDQEAVRVMKLMPKWIPGKQNGDPVYVYFSLPVIFRLSGKPFPASQIPIPDDIIIEIDGKVVSREDMQKLDMNIVESFSVNKDTIPNRLIIKTKKNN